METGRRQPTLDALLPLARVYRVSLDQLVDAPPTGDPRVHLEPRSMASGGVIVPLTDYPGRVRAFKHVLGPREPRLATHDGHAWLYVLAGRLRLLLAHAEHILEPGEAAQFDPTTPHWFGRPMTTRWRSCICSVHTVTGRCRAWTTSARNDGDRGDVPDRTVWRRPTDVRRPRKHERRRGLVEPLVAFEVKWWSLGDSNS